MEETTYWERLKAGQINALQDLYNHHAGDLYSYGMVLCQDEDRVKDCIHDLFLSFWTNRQGLSIPASGKAYLLVSLRRRIFDKGPKSNLQTHSLEEKDIPDDVTMGPEQRWIEAEEDSERQQKLNDAMARLSERQREIIHMKYFQQMEYEDIAQIMDMNYQSARNLVNRALMALRKEMIALVMILVFWM